MNKNRNIRTLVPACPESDPRAIKPRDGFRTSKNVKKQGMAVLSILAALFMFISPFQLYSQEDSSKANIAPKIESRSISDPVFAKDSAKKLISAELKRAPKDGEGFSMTKSPVRAMIYSILPGAGQIYVENYWKAPIFAGAAGALAYYVVSFHNDFTANDAAYSKYKKLLEESAPSINTSALESDIEIFRKKKDFYNNQRDMTAFYLLGVYIIATVDAYVGAHLYDFTVDENLSVTVLPNIQSGLSLNFSYRIK